MNILKLLGDYWTQITTAAAVVGILVTGAVRVYADEQKIENHDQQLQKQTEILQELKTIAVKDDAAKKARAAQCRKLIAAGKVKLADCDPSEE